MLIRRDRVTTTPTLSQPPRRNDSTGKDMLEFLMYRLEEILPEAEFQDIISQFSINTAQQWLDLVRDVVGVCCYDDIKKEFKAQQEELRRKSLEMHCFAKSKACATHPTIFQIDIGADKFAEVDGEGVDNLFTSLFVGL